VKDFCSGNEPVSCLQSRFGTTQNSPPFQRWETDRSQSAKSHQGRHGRISNLLGCRWQRMNPGVDFAGNPIESIEEGIHHRGTEAPRRGRSGRERIRIWFVKLLILHAVEIDVIVCRPVSAFEANSPLRTQFPEIAGFHNGINSDRARFEFSFGRCSFPEKQRGHSALLIIRMSPLFFRRLAAFVRPGLNHRH
jgi:hypothetical protein